MGTEISKGENRLNWYCRILMVVNLYLVISGYLGWYQTRYSLASPLIPLTTLYQILRDSRLFEASLVATGFLLTGILSFSFQYKRAALILLGLGLVVHQLMVRYQLF